MPWALAAWSARDTRLEGAVALQVLPELFSGDPERMAASGLLGAEKIFRRVKGYRQIPRTSRQSNRSRYFQPKSGQSWLAAVV